MSIRPHHCVYITPDVLSSETQRVTFFLPAAPSPHKPQVWWRPHSQYPLLPVGTSHYEPVAHTPSTSKQRRIPQSGWGMVDMVAGRPLAFVGGFQTKPSHSWSGENLHSPKLAREVACCLSQSPFSFWEWGHCRAHPRTEETNLCCRAQWLQHGELPHLQIMLLPHKKNCVAFHGPPADVFSV